MPLKHGGFFDFPMIRAGCFSLPSILAHNKVIKRLFDFLPPWQAFPFQTCIQCGIAAKKMPVSSALNMSRKRYVCKSFGRTSVFHCAIAVVGAE